MELSEDTPVTLIIKAPNQRMADQTVECLMGWTILKLKKHLENVYPTKPKHSEQRLIYSGRLLQDSHTLKEILRQYEDSLTSKYTVHLVCSSVMDSSSASSTSSIVNANSTQTAVSKPVASVSSGACSSETVNTSHTDGTRYRGHHQLPQPSSNHEPASAQFAYTAYQTGAVQGDMTSYTPEQYNWMMQQQQQIYSQYMMQYMMYYQNVYNPGLSVAPVMPPFSQQIVGNTHPQQQVPHAPDAAAANNGVQEAARPNVRMNAQGGMEEEDDDEGEPRDWLHHMYFFMRVLTFLGILFFYSNLTRFLIVFTGSFAIYILQRLRKYWQRIHQEHQQQQQQTPPPPPPQEQQQQNEQQQEQQDTPADVRNEEIPEDVPPPGPGAGSDQQPAVEEDGSRLTRIMTFVGNTVQAFFTSLLPTPPELLEQN